MSEPKKDIEEPMLHVDLSTGEVFEPGELPEPSKLISLISKLFAGTFIGNWAKYHVEPVSDLKESAVAYKAQLSMFKLTIAIIGICVVVFGHLLQPWLGAFVMAIYGFYFCLINISSLQNKLVKTHFAVLSERQYEEQKITKKKDDTGQYV